MGKKLFDDCDNADDISKIEIDEAFARRYEHNKKKEDLHRFQELKKKGIVEDSDDSDTESDDPELLDDNDDKFFDVLLKVKKHDPVIKEDGAKLFPEDDSEDEDKEGASEEDENEAERDKKEKKGKKPMHLKDVHAKNLIEYGAEYDEEGGERVGLKSYVDEQEALKRAFFNEAEKVDDEDGPLLKEKAGSDEDGDTDSDNDQNDEIVNKPIVEYFGADEELDENAMYLKKFFLNKMWIDKDKGKVLEDDIEKLSDEEEEVDMQEDYEREYNFRYQENAGERVLSHSRKTEDSVRKKSNPRKVQRQNKADRMASAKLEREEVLKHLKNLKKGEFLLKLKKVKDVAGISDECGFVLDKEDLEEEFDPKKHDRKMKEIFNDDYYNSMDAKPYFCSDDEDEDEDLKKPDFDEDILLGLPEGWDKVEEEKDVDDEEEMAHEERVEGKRKRKSKPSLLEKVALDDELDEKQKKELKEELYKLDYEGTVGHLKTRFPYRKVELKRFGLSGKEILMMDDGELNQYVSLKKIAPYVENEYKVPRIKRYEQKMKNKDYSRMVRFARRWVRGRRASRMKLKHHFQERMVWKKRKKKYKGKNPMAIPIRCRGKAREGANNKN